MGHGLTAYNDLFAYSSHAFALIIVVVSILTIALRTGLFIRSVFFSYGIWLAPLFLVLQIVVSERIGISIILACALEFSLSFFSLFFLHKLLLCVRQVNSISTRQLYLSFLGGFFAEISILSYFIHQRNFGIFSDASRIDYLVENRLNLFLTYALLMIGQIMNTIAACMVMRERRWNFLVLSYLLFSCISSVFSGSKGAVMLKVFSILSLIQMDTKRSYLNVCFLPLVSAFLFFVITVVFVGPFLNYNPISMVQLMYWRLFLMNDTRALAIDFERELSDTPIFPEAFRALANRLGHKPIHPPIGLFLYQLAFSTTSYSGGNASSSALLIAYGSVADKLLFFFSVLIIAGLLYIPQVLPIGLKIFRVSICLSLVLLLSQDFLAFPHAFFGSILLFAFFIALTSFNALSRVMSYTRLNFLRTLLISP